MECSVVRSVDDAVIGMRVFVHEDGEKSFGTVTSKAEFNFVVNWDDGQELSYMSHEDFLMYVDPESETYAIIVNDEIYARDLTKQDMTAIINIRLASGAFDVYYVPMKALKKISIRVKTETIVEFEE